MSHSDLDPSDVQAFHAFLESHGLNPAQFQVDASPGEPGEGELGASRRTTTVTHMPSGAARTYSFRTWVADFKTDQEDGVFGN